jgi:hypothetical protein
LLAFRASVDQHFAHVDHRFDAMISSSGLISMQSRAALKEHQ